MLHVLISTNHLVKLQGSELVTLELAEAFLSLNWNVTIFTNHYDDPIKEEFIKLEAEFTGALHICTREQNLNDDNFDLLWIQHSIFCDEVIKKLIDGTFRFGVIFNHMSSFADMEMPLNTDLENRIADKVLAVSYECKSVIESRGISRNLVEIFDNPVPSRFCDFPSRKRSLSLNRIAIISNHNAPELRECQSLFIKHNIQCDWYGVGHKIERVTAELLDKYDAIISIGKTVQYCLCVGVPIYVYDYLGGAGYLNNTTIEEEAFYNFSGRNTRRQISAIDIVKEVMDGYGSALLFAGQYRKLARDKWDFKLRLENIIQTKRPNSLKKIDEKEARQLRSHRGSMHEKYERFLVGRHQNEWNVQSWFVDRTPSSSRILAIQTMLKSNPDVGTLGVAVVVPNEPDIQLLLETLESLGAQHRPVDSVWLIGRDIPDEAAGDGIELLREDTPWPKLLSDRISLGNMPDFLWILHAGDCLVPHATLVMGEYRLRKPGPLVWYADEAVLDGEVPENPMLKPDFNIDLLRSYPYVGRNLVVSTAAIHISGGLDEQVADLTLIDFIWRLVEQAGPSVVGHVPEVLQLGCQSLMDWVGAIETMVRFPAVTQAHLRRLGLDVQIEPGLSPGLQRIEYPLSVQPLVSIIIPTRDQLSVLQACVEGLMEHTAYPHYELLIVDNGSVELEVVAFLAGLEGLESKQIRILRWPQKFDFSAMNNFAASQARGDVLLFLNNDIQFSARTRSDWLERLLRHAMRPEVGMVGSRLDLPAGGVDQCGQVLGMDNSVGLAFHGAMSDRQGYMNRLIVQQNVSALSASCLMVRRELFEELGGFDAESFPIYYADADLCMKATQAGYLLVLEPDTGLLHMGGATRLLTEKFGLSARPDDEQRDRLYARWLPQLARDPNYHPAFGKQSPGFELSPDASRINEPLPGRPLPIVMAAHADWHGCGYYRILHPFKAMADELRLEGGLKLNDFHFTDVARIQPDVIVLQGAWLNEGVLTQIRRYREITGAKVILEFDDYIPNIPTRSIYRKKLSQGLLKYMRRAMEQVDWIVVSTPILAQEYASYHHDIRVAHNGLLPNWWGALRGQRRTGKKMRVGWAGGSSHTGDLAEIRSVVKDLQDEVEWVFMGMKPDNIHCEFHSGVAIDKYPEKLASLNLDLAIVPLEINQFNRCKSNLRLLELGACGVPVICTDIEPYRGNLPVMRVRNKHQAWVEAIRSHLADPDALAQAGNALREAVLSDWMLEGAFLNQWQHAWLGGVSIDR